MRLSPFPFVCAFLAGAFLAFPADLDTSFQALREAVSKKDPAQVKTLAAETHALAREALATPAPSEESGKDAWTKSQAYAKDVDLFTEYALYATAVASPPETTLDLLDTLEQQNPKSRYLDPAWAHYFLALTKTGQAAKIPRVAEKELVNFPENEDLLMVLTDDALSKNRVTTAGPMAERLLAVMKRHSKPEDVTAADWERKKSMSLTRAYWIAGMAHAEKTEYTLCDQDLRSALPLVKGSESMLASTLFYLGVCNYHVGRQAMDRARLLEASKFSEQAAAIRSPFQRQAWTNAHLMKAEADKMLARK